jgi:Lar family restriction alleviation protein
MTDLKPCPFCGSSNVAHGQFTEGVQVSCLQCDVSGPLVKESIDCSFQALQDAVNDARSLWNQRADLVPAVVDTEGRTPSSQKGGCDYVSFVDAQKIFIKYIDCEMRDPNGLNDVAKAMLSFLRTFKRIEKNAQKPAVDLGGIYEAMKNVVIKWDSPNWKDTRHTSFYIDELRKAIAHIEAAGGKS